MSSQVRNSRGTRSIRERTFVDETKASATTESSTIVDESKRNNRPKARWVRALTEVITEAADITTGDIIIMDIITAGAVALL